MFDWLVARKDARVKRSPAGFLYRAISEDFPLPKDYVSAQAPAKRVPPQSLPLYSQTSESQTAQREERSSGPSDRKAIDQFWHSLPADEQARIERELVKSAPKFLRESYMEGREARGLLFKTARQAIIDQYAREKLLEAA
jgi:hypothetical protein